MLLFSLVELKITKDTQPVLLKHCYQPIVFLFVFFQEREFRLIKFLPEILNLQKRLVRKYQNATEDIVGSIREFIDQQTGADYMDLNSLQM